ncbi:MAG: peptidyl-prolyl cis-trans isomerase [Bdellovibrionales bacterium]
MLQTIRELAKSWVFKSLMLLLIVSFGIWGIGDIFKGNPRLKEVAKVGSIAIPVQTLEQRFQMGMPEARKVFGADLTVTQARQIGVLDRTLHLIIHEDLFDQEAARLGLNLNSAFVMSQLAQNDHFRDKDGSFNTQLWQQFLNKTGMSEQGFLDTQRHETARKLIFSSIASERPIPQIMIDTLYQARGAKRILEVLTLRNDSLKNMPKADDAALQAFYKDHESSYVVPEYRGVTVATLETDSLVKDIKVSEEQIKAAYESRASELMRPETRDLVQIVFQDEEKAKAFYEAAHTASNLTATAKAKGLTPVTMDKVSEKNILPELYTTVFTLEEGQISSPIKSSLGWHVLQSKKIHAGGAPSLDEVRSDLKKTLQDEQAGDQVASTVNKMDDMIAGGQSLETCADTLKLRLERFPSLDQTGHTPDGKEAKDIPNKDTVLRAAFELGQGETGQVIDGGHGKYYVVRNDQITPTHAKPFEEAKTQVAADWLKQQQSIKAAATAEDIAKALREGKTATSYASYPGVSLTLSKPLSQLSEPDRTLPAQAIASIFKMKKGDVITAEGQGLHYILRLSDIVPVDPKKPEETLSTVVEDVTTHLPQNVAEEYALYIRKAFPVTINNNMLNDLKHRGDESHQ